MSASALSPVQALVYGVLGGDATLTAIGPVYDHVPEQTSFPYVSLSDFRETVDDTLGMLGRKIEATIEAWSQAEGYKELETMANRIIELLDTDGLADPTGWTMVSSIYALGTLGREVDGLTRHGTLTFEILVTQLVTQP